MKILLIRSDKGIPDSRVEKEVYSLSKKYEVEVLAWDRSKDSDDIFVTTVDILDKKIKFYYIAVKAPVVGGIKKMLFPMLRFWKKERKFIKKMGENYDAYHFCDFDTYMPVKSLKLTGKKIYDIFDFYADTHNSPKLIDSFIRRNDRKLIESSDAIVICSEVRKNQILPAKPKQIAIVHNSPRELVMEEIFPLKKTVNEKKRYKIVYVGVLTRGRFLEEIASVIEKRADVELHIAGMGPFEQYYRNMEQKTKNIFYYGPISYSQAISLEKQCDIMIAIYDPRVRNHRYAAPNKFYEALFLGKPVIMMKNTGMDSYIEEYQVGVVIDFSNEDFCKGFNDALNSLIKQRNEWETMGRVGRDLYVNEFSWSEMEKRLLSLYESVLENK